MLSPNALVDVVIPTYGQAEYLDKCLAALGNRKDLNINVVDDKSLDRNAIRDVCAKYPYVKLFRNSDNLGFAGTCNKGASKGSAPVIFFLNTDCFLEPTAVDEMLKEMDDPRTGVVGALLVFPSDGKMGPGGRVQHAGMCFDITGKPFHIFIGWELEHPRVNQRREMNCVTGACFMTRRSLWKTIGGFSPAYGRGTYEDVEYCLLARQLGQKVVFTPKARGVHYVGTSGVADGQGFPLKQNFEIFKLRNRPNIIWDEFRYW